MSGCRKGDQCTSKRRSCCICSGETRTKSKDGKLHAPERKINEKRLVVTAMKDAPRIALNEVLERPNHRWGWFAIGLVMGNIATQSLDFEIVNSFSDYTLRATEIV